MSDLHMCINCECSYDYPYHKWDFHMHNGPNMGRKKCILNKLENEKQLVWPYNDHVKTSHWFINHPEEALSLDDKDRRFVDTIWCKTHGKYTMFSGIWDGDNTVIERRFTFVGTYLAYKSQLLRYQIEEHYATTVIQDYDMLLELETIAVTIVEKYIKQKIKLRKQEKYKAFLKQKQNFRF